MQWLTADEALAILGTKPQTLYANVSRGRIRARPLPDDPRRSLYHSDDVRRLAARHPGRKKDKAVAADAIRWGEPVLASAISTISDGRLLYRGRDAAELSRHASFEETAALLWQAQADEIRHIALADTDGALPSTDAAPLERAFVALAKRAAGDMPSLGRAPAVLQREGFGLIGLFFVSMIGSGSADQPAHERIAQAWRRPEAADAIRRALVLLADHELNASTFAARVAASTGAPLSAAVLAGLSALIGPRHGRSAASMEMLLARARQKDAAAALKETLQTGMPLTAFGHPLYREAGDVRAAALLERIEPPPHYRQLEQAAWEMLGERPNVDFALTALTETYALPADTPLLLFALARIAGWLAHALEQAETGTLIRPRAEFLPPPG
ncbi:MAG: citrate synthase family protein [Rhizobiales bacterium]|nr:citrate synthase family protein [Hyphomicrobiales bacterium]OJX99173.1 MAG: citrate synthase [Rhizobiales bacterium 63-22]